jgi:tetratricopeptide (TPR) repeat protein
MSGSLSDSEASSRPAGWPALLVLAIVIALIYGRAAHSPFVHDDNTSVLGNPSIARLFPLLGTSKHPGPLNPPRDAVTSGRPLVNLTLAVNYYFGGYDTLGYHIVNIAVHILSTLLLYGVIRRTLLLERFRRQFAGVSRELALACAAIWAVHPLQSDSVEYVSQRTESMMGLFFLATLFASIRYFTADWRAARVVAGLTATVACLCGMACKEVMVAAPVMALLFDWTFISGSIRRAVKTSWPLYCGLASGWLLLLALNTNAPRSHAAGLNAGLPAYVWWFTQAKVVLLYLKLAIWPWPLVIHRDAPLIWTFAAATWWLIPVALLGAASVILLWRRNAFGYLGVWFFIILSPTLVVPMPSEVVAERRMYLPLAAVVVAGVVGGFAALARREASARRETPQPPSVAGSSPRPAALPKLMTAAGALTIVFCVVTSWRLSAYRDAVTIWQDAVAHQPQNVRATINFGCALEDAGRRQEAIEQFERALEIDPGHPDVGLAHRSLGLAFARLRQPERAIDHLQLAMRLRPDVANDHDALGSMLLSVHRFPEALDQLEMAVRQDPTDVLAHANLASAYANLGHSREALAAAEHARALARERGQSSWAAQADAWLKSYRSRLTQR